MNPFARFIRALTKWQFRVRGLATIPEIPTEEFNQLVERLQTEGWEKTYEYHGYDAWIDYGCIRLKRNGVCLKCEWDNYHEGSIEGRAAIVEEIAQMVGRKSVPEWRFAVWG